MTRDEFKAWGYEIGKEMPDGTWVAVLKFYSTYGLLIGVDDTGFYRTRYCYEHLGDAIMAAAAWDGQGDPIGPWIKQKPEERLGPGAIGKFNYEAQNGRKEQEIPESAVVSDSKNP